MVFCHHCGNELVEGTAFCNACGTQVPTQTTNLVAPANSLSDEQEFLDVTHRLLRWEQKAWSIAGKAFLITGIVFAALFLLFAIVFIAAGSYVDETLGGLYLFYSIFFGGTFIGFSIVSKKAADKIPFYLNNLYADFRYTYDRCGSVGMLVFNVILGAISPIFFIINFVRIKANRALIQQILIRQQQF